MTSRINCGLVALALGSGAGLLAAGSASAAPTWLPADNLRSPVASLNADVASDPAGNSVAVWDRFDDLGDADPSNNRMVVEYAYRPAGGSFGAPQVISGNVDGGPFSNARNPDVAMDSEGRALITWEYDDRMTGQARARVRGADGSLGAIQDLMPDEPGMSLYSAPVAAVSPDGHAAVVWAGVPDVIYATTGTLDGGLPRATRISSPNEASEWATCPHVAIDHSGNALFAWQGHGDRTDVIEAVAKPSSGGLGAVATLSMNIPFKSAECPRVALDPRGRATVVWSLRDSDPDSNGVPDDDVDRDLLQYATRSAPAAAWEAGTFSSVGGVPTLTETQNSNPDVVVDADNTAIVVWSGRDTNDRTVIQAASRPSGGGFGNHQTLSGPGRFGFAGRVAIGANGAAVATWLWSATGADQVVQAAQRPAGTGTSFGTVAEEVDGLPSGVRAEFVSPEAAVDGEGNAIGAWVRTRVDSGQNTDHVPRFAALDAAPPTLADINVPSSATTGQKLAFSATARDRWSATTTSWNFGDGRTALGTSVAHAFTSPGTYTVMVTSTDDVGNAVSATRTVQVKNPDPATPAPVVTDAPAPVVATAQPGGVDADRDGFFSNQDCDDAHAGIRPNAQELRGNRIDENCDGRADDYLAITSPLNWSWHVNRTRLAITKLTARDLPSGATIELRCSGKRCPVKRKHAAAPRGRSVDVLATLAGRRWRFRAGQTLEVRITAPDRIGKVVRFRLQRKRIPTGKALCLRPGAGRPAPCGR